MPNTPAAVNAKLARRLCAGLGFFAVAAGLGALSGWFANIPALASWGGPNRIATQPNTALAAALAGIAVVLLAYGYRRTASAIGALPGLIGAATLFEYMSGMDLGIDRLLLFDRPWTAGTVVPGRPGLPASTSLTLLGTAFVLIALPPAWRRFAPALGIAVMSIAFFSVIGYLFDANPLFTVPTVTAIALPTTLMLTALAAGLIGGLPELEPMRTFREDSAAGLLARQSLPFIIVLPVLLAFLRLKGQIAGLYDTGMGTAILVIVLITLLLVLLWQGVAAVRVREASQRRVEEALRVRETQLRDADRHKDEFIATLAHELRNPLAPISNSLSIMKHANVEPRLLERTRDMMERQVNHMVRLIDDLLDISRVSSGKLELRLGTIDVASVVHQAIETCRPLIDRGRHELTIDLPRESLRVDGDSVRLAQVFGNLISNSCKFTEPGGHIRVSAERQGDTVVVYVEDDGLGIPAEQLENIFEIFAQVDRTIERSRGGLGIGLTLAKRLVQLHGGRIAVASDGLGKGSKFIVRLPAALGPAQVAAELASRSAGAMKRRILVVDDNRDNADSLAMLLALRGNETHTAHDGEEAVEAVARLHPDAVLLDIGLPKLNGYEACRRIREQLGERKMPIYAITGWGQEHDRQRSREAGFNGHFVKPIDNDTLTKLLASL